MKETSLATLQLKKNVELLRAVPGGLLFSVFGRRRWIRANQVEEFGEIFFRFAMRSFSIDEAAELLRPWLSRDETLSWIDSLMRADVLIRNVKGGGRGQELTHSAHSQIENDRLGLHAFFELFTNEQETIESLVESVSKTRLLILSRMNFPEYWAKTFTHWREVSIEPLRYGVNNKRDPNIFYLIVALESDRVFLDRANHWVLGRQERTLVVTVDSAGCSVGPLIGIEGQPCLHCLELRKRSARADGVVNVLDSTLSTPSLVNSFSWPDFFWRRLQTLIDLECVKIVSECTLAQSHLGISVHDFVNGRSILDRVFPSPSCTECQ